ncbi:hypothetical protein A671_02611 [Salmonella enterica subsp. enterica serovar Dublin str. DG22]|uniref:Uncharacterized protein n=1 Tax=Salmonella enterica subsp. enterica serovar Dublin str. UC16 TaxID=1192688 RepID=M7SHV1_SALDU|nr:hypothetical protein A670_00286 [Salmonella enterica subsp. enterica serovar Dublin str. UC16]EPI69413.1 hypothetical protein A671_02611 [Salmonella enterica subsp. enterica serovar Dublin str. DG22]
MPPTPHRAQCLVSLNQLRHIIAVNFPLVAFLIGITGHPRLFI